MAAPGPTTLDRMLFCAVELIRERGAAGATIDSILTRSNAPRGSVYHHFPGGRSQIIGDALMFAGETMSGLIADSARNSNSREALRRFIKMWKSDLVASDFDAGCPIAVVAIDGLTDNPELRTPVAATFASWLGAIASLIESEGIETGRANRLACLAVASIEGGIILCRAERRLEPLDDIRQELDTVLASIVGPAAA